MRLKKDERQLLIPTIFEMAIEAMFTNPFYGFGGRQMEGRPIGLRGTCTVARLVMQVLDGLVEEAGLKIELYMRYMDDGRRFLQPVKRGGRWIG